MLISVVSVAHTISYTMFHTSTNFASTHASHKI